MSQVVERAEERLSIEISDELMGELKHEYQKRKSESNPGTIMFDDFLQVCISLGVQKMAALDAGEVLLLVEQQD